MKKSIKIPLLAAVCLAFGLLQVSCDKAEPEQGNCFAIVVPDTLRFNVFDKNTKEKLFLSESPKYDLGQLRLFSKSTGEDGLREIEYLVSDEQDYLYTYVTAGSSDNIIYLQIGEQPMDEISFTFKLVKQNGCSYHFLDQVTFNNEASEKNAHGRVVPFYRDE